MFAHDPSTNRLSLVGEGGPPWIADGNDAWNYCVDCWESHFSTGDKSVQHVPFRDRASQANMVVSWRERKRKAEELSDDDVDRQAASQNSQGAELEADAMAGPGAAEGEESRVVDDEIFQQQEFPGSDDEKQPDIGEAAPPHLPQDQALDPDEAAEEELPNDNEQVLLPTEPRPTLQEYKAKWESLLAEHSRSIEGAFSAENLCPKPIHQLWQDCARLMINHVLHMENACCRTRRCLQPRPLRAVPQIDLARQPSPPLRLQTHIGFAREFL